MAEHKKPQSDAGLRSLDHYKERLPAWRFAMRDRMIWLVRYETAYLARIQHRYRTPSLDAYFAFTAVLGTHTFFMVGLPVLFWCGYLELGRAMINVLASGVIATGVLKDLFCLPRPLSPPLQRINKSKSAALEYGFPSTHSTNAMSVAAYGIYLLCQYDTITWLNVAAQAFIVLYTISIVLGRLYCGMHGFLDVGLGGALGLFIAGMQYLYGNMFDVWIWDGDFKNVLIVGLLMGALVRVHPEPADDCPCFDDSVSFAGVVFGIQLGTWHFAQSGFSSEFAVPGTAPFSFERLGLIKAVVRIMLGIAAILVWRAAMKPTLLKALPPVFRVVEQLGLSLPRKFFMKASDYQTVPPLKRDDSIIPQASDIPRLLNSLLHPRRRAVSVGPQSEADAYEAMAVRVHNRRERRASQEASASNKGLSNDIAAVSGQKDAVYARSLNQQQIHARPSASRPEDVQGSAGPLTPADEDQTIEFPAFQMDMDEKEDQELFAKLQKPRVRYDVEVITRLIVYAGIGWIATEGGPLLFEILGLGLD